MAVADNQRTGAFTKELRLLNSNDFATIRKKGERHFTKSFVVYVYKNDLGRERLGLAVSARTGNAVRRNRIKRLVREFFRLNRKSISPSVDIVVSARKGLVVKDLSGVTKELSFLFTGGG